MSTFISIASNMDNLPESLLIEILSRLTDSTESTRSRLISKSFNSIYPDLRSINLQCSLTRYIKSRSISSNSSQIITPFKLIFLNLISKLRIVESVCIGTEKPLQDVSFYDVEDEGNDLHMSDGEFVKEWLPRVCGSLKSLSISDFWVQSCWRRSDLLSIVSEYCHNLVELEVKNAWLSVDNLNPMPMLTSLTLEFIRLDDENLNQLNNCFPNLQVLNLIGVGGFKQPRIHLLNLKTCHWVVSNAPLSLSIITPNLLTLKLECVRPTLLQIQAPVLHQFHFSLNHADKFIVQKFFNLKTFSVESLYIGSLLSNFPVTETVENLTVDSRNCAKGVKVKDSELTLQQVFTVFPNLRSVCVKARGWVELEACFKAESWEIFNGRKRLKSFCAYLLLVDPGLSLSAVGCVLDQCVGLFEVSLLIHKDVVGNVSKRFMLECMGRWPGLKWRWGIWREGIEDSWITEIS